MSEQPEIQFQPRRRASSNRQRPKVRDEDRKRIAVACDHCKTRKIRCTGEQPCRQCYLANITCNYPPASAKIVVPELFVDKLQARIYALEKALCEAVPDQAIREDIFGQRTDLLAPETELFQATILRLGTNQTDFRAVQRDIQVSLEIRLEQRL
ncbi:uncharacterized protein LAJ45_00512 [Morchella importuna]|uniref:uncharacterized protein n=1 Tax=Morchella importuna TaxID=1174673 RepID=UPI001E8E821F|nr:uncharacterized protein LAJ45_00512 [Morchella importuna]KAH8155502.1 hypothetical protein LAJ45_00512 [Morchella importuna]